MKIEKETLIKILDCCIEDDCCHCPNAYKDGSIVACEDLAHESVSIPYSIMRETINALKEQPDIVRCGECKYYSDGFCYNPNTFDSEKTCGNTVPDWYCADGKRR